MKISKRVLIRIVVVVVIFAALASIPALAPVVMDPSKTNVEIENFQTVPARPVIGEGNRFTVRVKNLDGKAVTGANVEAHISMPAMSHSVTSKAEHTGEGVYRGELPLTMLGTWELKIRVDDGENRGERRYRLSYQADKRSFAVSELTDP